MLSWANTRTAAPKSALGKAFHYLKEQWQYLTNYLKDGRLELSNNRAERSIKPFVIDRKNFLFANTPRGATSSAVMFSMLQTALENNLDPWRYLVWLMKAAKHTENMDILLPWNAPQECRTKFFWQVLMYFAKYCTELPVSEVMIFPNGDAYYICPNCHITVEREFISYCDCCGQHLG